ncbi:arsenical pump membrane protein-domain-containing protein [Lasiosphaeris hirsuta]|uniref:Arsenical pump membrane protein-domain-containing protein n=1 Tax=Lasiosphaeris hirsuta TaxID=260670 RepID=A0AA40A385_9PEZI|nr:arsenical pump membrane protein-domain-containing protein [Lasiosphaeris hirsuta]
MAEPANKLDTSIINEWRSIVTLIVFVFTNINVLFPFHIPIYLPRYLSDAAADLFAALKVAPLRRKHLNGASKTFVRFSFPMNFVTAPLIADLFLLAISAIGRDEVRGGTLGADHISPLDIMLFFITLAYIAISIDASGVIRWLAYKVLLWGGNSGRRLFLYLYMFFALLGCFIGNDPIILSGTPFLAYMTRVSSNIKHPRAWIFTQFAVANIVSAILVSSNPTNLVLAGAFQIRFIDYTVNMIVPVVITVVVLFPILLYVIFRQETLIPRTITLHELPEEIRAKKPKNPCIPYARGAAEEEEEIHADDEKGQLLELAEIMHPFLDKKSAIFGTFIIAVTLIVVLVLNAVKPTDGELPVFWVTLPAAVVMFLWDISVGWLGRKETREIAHNGRRELENGRTERAVLASPAPSVDCALPESHPQTRPRDLARFQKPNADTANPTLPTQPAVDHAIPALAEKGGALGDGPGARPLDGVLGNGNGVDVEQRRATTSQDKTTLVSLVSDAWAWSRETFPTATSVLSLLPLALVPFAFAMFVLVQALVTKGWVPVFAYGWDHWVNRTGTIGAIGGMGFVSVVLCNFAGTNIGTTILICRVLQAWQAIHEQNGTTISNRTFWATVYSMALGVNYGAFSTAFSGSLAGLLWRDILGRKHIHVRARDFARFNIPIIAASMVVGCAVLIGEVYITRDTQPYVPL